MFQKGLAGGLVTMAYGLSSMFVPVAASALIGAFGITTTFMVFGAACGVVICSAGLLSGAARKAFVPAAAVQSAKTSQPSSGAGRDKNWKEMLATPAFYPMLILFICGSTGAMMLISSAAMLSEVQIGLAQAAAAASVSLLAAANTAGRFASGAASDRFGRLPSLAASLLLAMAGLAAVMTAGGGDMVLFFAGLALTAWCYGSFVGIFPGFTVEQFGLKYNSVNYGIMAAGFSTAGIIGPMLLKTFAEPGDFTQAYLAGEAVCAVGLVMVLICLKLCREAPGSMKTAPEQTEAKRLRTAEC